MADILKGPVVANKYKPVPTIQDDDVAPGDWLTVIHDCPVPSIAEIIRRSASVGSEWKCTGQNCGDAWVLRRNRDYRADSTPTVRGIRVSSPGFSEGVEPTEQDIQDEKNREIALALQWVRKRDLKDEG